MTTDEPPAPEPPEPPDPPPPQLAVLLLDLAAWLLIFAAQPVFFVAQPLFFAGQPRFLAAQPLLLAALPPLLVAEPSLLVASPQFHSPTASVSALSDLDLGFGLSPFSVALGVLSRSESKGTAKVQARSAAQPPSPSEAAPPLSLTVLAFRLRAERLRIVTITRFQFTTPAIPDSHIPTTDLPTTLQTLLFPQMVLFEAAWKASMGTGDMGWFLQSSDLKFHSQDSTHRLHGSSAFGVEALAILPALLATQAVGITFLVYLLDCQDFIHLLNASGQSSELERVMFEFQTFCHLSSSILFCLVALPAFAAFTLAKAIWLACITSSFIGVGGLSIN